IQCPAVFTARTYGELHTAVFRTPAAAPETAPPQSRQSVAGDVGFSEQVSLAGGLGCGIDIEMVDNLPRVQDYWDVPFYTATFSAAETAYCLLQASPPIHFAARWCAKEALKKCDPAYSHLVMNQLEVVLTATGAPVLQSAMHGTWERVPVTVSLSHTTSMAAAVGCVSLVVPGGGGWRCAWLPGGVRPIGAESCWRACIDAAILPRVRRCTIRHSVLGITYLLVIVCSFTRRMQTVALWTLGHAYVCLAKSLSRREQAEG